jgi:hypothetical protein
MRSGQVPKAVFGLLAMTLTAMWAKAIKDGIPWGDVGDGDDEEEQGWGAWTRDAFTKQSIESIPLVGKEAGVLYDRLRGEYRGDQYSAIAAPVERALRAVRLYMKDEEDDEKTEENEARASWFALEALSLSGVPVPYTGVKRIIQSTHLWSDEGSSLGAALNMVGRRPPRIE